MQITHKIAEQIRIRMGQRRPKTAIILGSGLGSLADTMEDTVIINYSDINGFPQSTVQGHNGRLIIGRLADTEVLCMQGRFHIYEGHQPQVINSIIKAFQLLGIKNLIVTNAAGSLRKSIAPGELMLITDHINLSGTNPLIGPNDDRFGPRFPSMADAYTFEYQKKILSIAKALKIKLKQGVYLWTLGPNFETKAEIKMFQRLGADAVGMSTVPEVICAVHSGMKVLGISVITNYGTGMQKNAPSHEETLAEGQKAAQNLSRLLTAFMKDIDNG